MLRHLLETAGHEVHEAADGRQGLQMALALRPDVALIDLGLPGLDGYEIARQLRAADHTRRILLVAVTGYGAPEDRERSLLAGFGRAPGQARRPRHAGRRAGQALRLTASRIPAP